jgi:acyl-coenzyme A thioesterase PaaI-like protein
VANFPAKIGVTAWIKVNYVAPTRADQFVVFQGKVDKAEGRKVFVSGTLEDLDGNLLVTAEYVPSIIHILPFC